MNVVMAGYQAISILHGGPRTQLRETAAHLGRYGVQARLFDCWESFDPASCDLFHVFAANIGTYHLAREIHALGVPLAVSPIVFSRHSPVFIRTALRATRAAQRFARGIWSDYALTADMAGWAAGVLPNTGAEASLLQRGYGVPRAKLEVIPNGVDERFLHAAPEAFVKRYGLKGFVLTVGHTGHERKNTLALIRALAGTDHPAVIIGRIIRSPYGDACVREAAKHRHILLLDGFPHDAELLASAYAAADVFVLPSLFETPGIAALEAGLAGAKVVITRHGGTVEYFGDRADYVEPGSVESIRRGIERALGRTRDDRLQEHIRSRYLWTHVAERTAGAYRNLLGRA